MFNTNCLIHFQFAILLNFLIANFINWINTHNLFFNFVKKIKMKTLIIFLLLINMANFSEAQIKETPTKETMVDISTEFGTIRIKLFNNTPIHRDNFIKLVKDGFYDGTLFHRVINNFMIQGGDPDSKDAKPGQMLGQGGPGYTLEAEIVKSNFHRKGALAAARLGDNVNPEKRSSGSQFYIVHGRTFTDSELDNLERSLGFRFTMSQRNVYKNIGGAPHLDGSYTVFGEVVSGLDVLDRIASVKKAPGDRPIADIRMTMSILE